MEELLVKETNYTEEEQKKIKEIVDSVDINDEMRILSFATNLQRLISTTSLMAMTNMKENKMEGVENSFKKLVNEINTTVLSRKRILLDKLFKNKHGTFKERLIKANNEVEAIEIEIKEQQYNIVKDMLMYAEMYKRNLNYYKQISMHIEAGNQFLNNINKKAKNEDISYPNVNDKDLDRKIDKFDNRIKDLEVSRIVSMQLATELKLMQNMNYDLAHKIQSTVLNTIPIWHNQVIIAIGINSINENIASTKRISKKIKQSTNLVNNIINKQTELLNNSLNIDNIKSLQETSQDIIKTAKSILNNIKDNKNKQVKILKTIEKENSK